MSFFGKTATVRFVRLVYLDFSHICPIETTNEPFGLKNINKPVRALGPSLYAVNVEGFPAELNCPESSLNPSYYLIYC